VEKYSRLRLKCDGTRAETRFRLSAKRTSPCKSAGASVQSTAGSRGVRISDSNAGYIKFRGSEGYWLPTPFASFPFTSPPVRHRVLSRFNWTLQRRRPQMTIWHMRIACWTTKAINTHTYTIYNYSCLSPAKMLHECASILPYTYSACLCKLDNRQYLTIPKWYLRVTDYTGTRNIGHTIICQHSCPTQSASSVLTTEPVQ